jgi:hypothetical protein
MDPDQAQDPAVSVIDLQDVNKKLIFSKKLFFLLLFEGTFTSFFKDKKSQKKSQSSRNQILLGDRRIRIRTGPGSIPLTTGYG